MNLKWQPHNLACVNAHGFQYPWDQHEGNQHHRLSALQRASWLQTALPGGSLGWDPSTGEPPWGAQRFLLRPQLQGAGAERCAFLVCAEESGKKIAGMGSHEQLKNHAKAVDVAFSPCLAAHKYTLIQTCLATHKYISIQPYGLSCIYVQSNKALVITLAMYASSALSKNSVKMK